MSPFKVIRCRYYSDDGKAIHPYCSAGRRCTFLHPGDKGWPGGDPTPQEVSKRPDERDRSSEWPRLRARKSSDRSDSHSKANMSKSGDAAATSMMSLVSEVPNPSTRKVTEHKSKDHPAVSSIVQTFHDIAKFQTKITQDRENLDRAIDKFAAFKELSESLGKVSSASAAAVNPTLDAIIKTRHELELKLEDDTKQLSGLWNDVFTVFLRAVCRQFDDELEAGADFLHQEARTLVKLFPKTSSDTQHDSTSKSLNNSVPSRAWQSSVMGGPSDDCISTGRNTGDAKGTSREETGEEKGEVESVNPPIGLSDNGWGRKRRRVSSDSADETECADSSPHDNLKDIITRMQAQLDEQGEKIKSLIEQNQALQQHNNLQSKVTRPSVTTSVQSLLSSSPQTVTPRVFDDIVSHVRRTLQSDILAFIAPALENQKQVNEYWGMRLSTLTDELMRVSMIRTRDCLEDGTMTT